MRAAEVSFLLPVLLLGKYPLFMDQLCSLVFRLGSLKKARLFC